MAVGRDIVLSLKCDYPPSITFPFKPAQSRADVPRDPGSWHPSSYIIPLPRIGVSEKGSAKTGSAIDVRIDDAGSILKFRIGFSL